MPVSEDGGNIERPTSNVEVKRKGEEEVPSEQSSVIGGNGIEKLATRVGNAPSFAT